MPQLHPGADWEERDVLKDSSKCGYEGEQDQSVDYLRAEGRCAEVRFILPLIWLSPLGQPARGAVAPMYTHENLVDSHAPVRRRVVGKK